MKNLISATALFLFASAAFAQPADVSASYEAPVSASAVAQDDVSSPSVSATAVASDVSAPNVSSPYIAATGLSAASDVSAPSKQDDSDSLAMAGLGFGLFVW